MNATARAGATIDIRPQPGPQDAFCATQADLCVFGGAAGGGKSYGLILDALRYVSVPGFTGVYFRRTYPQLVAPDGLWDLSMGLFPHLGGTPREHAREWKFPANSRVIMSHLQYERDVYAHQGAQYCGIWLDELTHFTARQFWYLLSRNRSTCGVRPFIRATCNPDPDSFVAGLIAWWLGDDGLPIPGRSGALRWFVRDGDGLDWDESREALEARHKGAEALSMTFVGALLSDNAILCACDPGYRSRLEAMHVVERERLLHGNWAIRPAAGLYFKRHWLPVFDELPGSVQADVRAWDKAATEPSAGNTDPDWTRGVRISRLAPGGVVRYVVRDVAGCRANPGEVDRLMRTVASQDGRGTSIAIWQDPGQAGKVDVDHTRRNLDGYTVSSERASQNKVTYAGPLSSACEGGLVGLMRGDWNEKYIGELVAFPEHGHDDQVDASSLAYRRLTDGQARRATPRGSEQASRWRI